MKLPQPRGPVSAAIIAQLGGQSLTWPSLLAPNDDDDLHVALFICYELAYRGWDGVDDRWEWDLGLLEVRANLERRFEADLTNLVGPRRHAAANTVPTELKQIVAASDHGPSLSGYLRGRATHEQFREFVVLRSVYHLREADPHTWAIPRLSGRPKGALIEIQLDEYGKGVVPRMHQELFKQTMNWFDLDITYGAYVDSAGAATLATNNLMSLFGLHRRNRGALIGHLAAYEMTSSLPNRAYTSAFHDLERIDE